MNTIVDILIEQINTNCWDTGHLKEIISVISDPYVSVPRGQSLYTNINVIDWPVITTKWWDIQVKWDDQTTAWFPLHMIKQLNTIEVTQFVVSNVYAYQTAFRWWFLKVMKK